MRSSDRGFTFIELMVVLVVLGLMTALLAPRLTGRLSNETLEGSARSFVAFSRYATAQAHSQGSPVWIVLSSVDRGYWLEYGTQGTRHYLKTLPGGVSASASPDRIAVYPDGGVDAADVIFKDKNGENSKKVSSRGFFGEFVLEA